MAPQSPPLSEKPRVGHPLLILLLSALLCVRGSLAEIVTDEQVTVLRGEKVALLRCTLRGTEKLSQVSWLKAASSASRDRTNLAVYNPQFGTSYPNSPFVDRVRFRNKDPRIDASLELLDVLTSDEGVFFCQISTFPTGSFEGSVNLSVIVKPVLTLEATPGLAASDDETEVVVATCRAAGGRPPAALTWDTPPALHGNRTERREQQADGTVTVTSEFRLAPSRAADGQRLQCTAKHPSLAAAGETMATTLGVQYVPEVTAIEGFDNNWYVGRVGAELLCQTVGNPPATITWKKVNASLSEDVRRLGNALRFSTALSHVHAGVYVCEAANTLGTRLGVVEVEIRDKPAAREAGGGSVGAILGGIIAAVLIIALVVTAIMLYRRQQRRRKPEGAMEEPPPSHKPPPPSKKGDHGSNIRMMPLENDNKEEELQKMPLQSQYYDTGAPNSNYPDHTVYDNDEDGDEKQYMTFPERERYPGTRHDYGYQGEQDDDYEGLEEQMNPVYNALSYSDQPGPYGSPEPSDTRGPYISPNVHYV